MWCSWTLKILLVVGVATVTALKQGGKKGKAGKSGKRNSFSLRIIHVNDHHSHLEAQEVAISPDSSYPASVQGLASISVEVGGWPLLTSSIEHAVDEAEKMDMEVLKLHAGDAVTGTILYTLFDGKADADYMNTICYDAFALGNHEFDDGDAGLAQFLDFLEGKERNITQGVNKRSFLRNLQKRAAKPGRGGKKGTSSKCQKTPVLAANVVPGPDSPLVGRLAPFEIFHYNGNKVGVIGIDVRNKTLLSSSPDEGTTLLDEVEVATAQVNRLTMMGVEIIVLLTHVGLDFDLTNMAKIPGVDVVVGGDSHTFMGYTPPAPVEDKSQEYPEFVFRPDGSVACVVQAYQYSVLFGLLDVVFDKNGNVLSCRGNPIVPFDPTSFVPELTKSQAMDLTNYLDGPFWRATTPDEDAVADLEVYLNQTRELAATVIADVPEDICYERIPGEGRSQICSCAASAMMGGGVCNVVSKAFLEVTKTADITIQNGGGCRTDIRMGDYTIEDAFTLLPFSNTLVTLEMTGQQIIDVLNEAIAFSASTSTGAYPYAYGIRFDVQYPTPGVSNVEVNPRLAGTWSPIDVDKLYTVVANSFVARGGDGFATFTEISNIVDTFIEYGQAFVDYATAVGTILDLPDEEYSTQSIVGGRMCPAA